MKGAVIYRGEKYFKFLKKIFDSIENVQKNYNWLITGYECYPQNIKYVERLSKEWCWITGKELTKMIETENFQWIWGVFSAFPESVTKDDALKYELPKADGNEKIWKNPISIQHPLSVKSFHDPFIHIPRKCIRDTSGKYKYISCRQLIQFLIECLNRCICNNRSLSVDLTFLI